VAFTEWDEIAFYGESLFSRDLFSIFKTVQGRLKVAKEDKFFLIIFG
jgi:hypothetical protein